MRKSLFFAFSLLFLLIHINIFAQTENQDSTPLKSISFVASAQVNSEDELVNTEDSFYLILNGDGTGLLFENGYVSSIYWIMPDDDSFQITDRLGYTYDGTFDNEYLVLSYDEIIYYFEQTDALPIMSLASEQWASGIQPNFFIKDESIQNQIGSEKIAEINNKAADISEKYNIGVQIIIIPDFLDYSYSYDIQAFSEEIIDGYRLEKANEGNTLLLVMSMAERDYDICASGIQSNEIFTTFAQDLLENAMLPHFKDNNWADGFTAYLDECDYILECAANGEIFTRAPRNKKAEIIIALIIGLLIGLIARACVKSSYNNQVKQEPAASNYIIDDSFKLAEKSDVYTHTTSSSRYSPRSSSSSHSRGGSSGRSHSSGKF